MIGGRPVDVVCDLKKNVTWACLVTQILLTQLSKFAYKMLMCMCITVTLPIISSTYPLQCTLKYFVALSCFRQNIIREPYSGKACVLQYNDITS